MQITDVRVKLMPKGDTKLRARYCNHCGTLFLDNLAKKDSLGRLKLHADIVHPINATCRQHIQQTFMEAFRKELDLSQQPGYHPQELGYEPED